MLCRQFRIVGRKCQEKPTQGPINREQSQWCFRAVNMSISVESPIVVLDSGLGGLTVVQALKQALPAEEIVYLGDTARLPYGSKSAATVTSFIRQIISYLRPCQPKHVVIACNTASALALPAVRSQFPELMLSGVIEPGA